MRRTLRWDFSEGGCPSLFAGEFHRFLAQTKQPSIFPFNENQLLYCHYAFAKTSDCTFGFIFIFILIFYRFGELGMACEYSVLLDLLLFFVQEAVMIIFLFFWSIIFV
ncbi:hypothetical protein Pfo_017218 [Paulownia fortunei]|nr:hypothetical protein Pfo_017218 [Paulownia fortunei]